MAIDKRFWEVVLDDELNLFEIVGISYDDRKLNSVISKMQDCGMHVRNLLSDGHKPESEVVLEFSKMGYLYTDGLYKKLMIEFERKSPSSKDSFK